MNNKQFEGMLQNNPVFDQIYQNAKTNAILVMDEDGYIVALNEAFQHSFGYMEDDLIGVHTRVLFTEEDQKALLPEMEIEKVRHHGSAIDRNYIVHHDGSCFWASGESVFTRDVNGKAYLIKLIQNIHEQKLLEKFLKESQAFSESVIGSIQDGVLVVDFESRILKVNNCFHSIFELENRRVEGLPLANLNDPFFSSKVLVSLLQKIKEADNNNETLELLWKGKDDAAKTLLIKASLLDGKLVNKKVLLVFSDVTKAREAHKMAEESARRFHSLIEAMPQKVWTADSAGNRIFFNGHCSEYTGHSLEELKSGKWENVIHPEDRERTHNLWQEALQKGEDLSYEHRILRKDGIYRWHLVRCIAQKDEKGKVEMWVCTNTDIHDQKMLEEELELRVKERTKDLQHSNEQLERSNRDLEQFAFVSSHDLQEPLRKILTFVDRLKSSAANNLNDEENIYIQKILQSTRRMKDLIKDVLDYSKLNHSFNAHRFVRVNLNKVLQHVLHDLEIEIEQKEASITSDSLPILEAVELQMNQLFFNLLSNSLKFQREGNKPAIHITCSELSSQEKETQNLESSRKYIKLVFSDNGLGFDSHYASQIFDFFRRLHAKESFPGTGIGLALCKKVVENHQGIISAQSEEGKGARFNIILPLQHQ